MGVGVGVELVVDDEGDGVEELATEDEVRSGEGEGEGVSEVDDEDG